MTTSDRAGDGQHPYPPDPEDPTRRMVDAAQVAQMMGGKYTASTVVRSYRHWGLTPHDLGKELRWKEAEVWAWIESRRRDD
jgi:hypothetical protein